MRIVVAVGGNALIKAGQEGPEALSVALVIRGNAYAGKGELDLALKDLDESIRINPKAAIAYSVRASIRSRRKEYWMFTLFCLASDCQKLVGDRVLPAMSRKNLRRFYEGRLFPLLVRWRRLSARGAP